MYAYVFVYVYVYNILYTHKYTFIYTYWVLFFIYPIQAKVQFAEFPGGFSTSIHKKICSQFNFT